MPRTASERHEKLELTDTLQDVCVKMSEGNPGALSVLVTLTKHGGKIDTIVGDDGILIAVMHLDTLGVYGSNLWVLWKDVCQQNLGNLLVVIRGFQLGFLTRDQVHHAIQNRGDGIDLADTRAKVQDRLGADKFVITDQP